MYRNLLFAALFLFVARSNGQGSFQDQSWNFGEVSFWNNDTAWFTVNNPTRANLVFLPTFYNEQFRVLLGSKSIEPGGSARVGIVYYSGNAGKFSADVPLYVNQKAEPIIFHIKGNIKSFDPMAETRCPSVNMGAEDNRLEKIVIVEVRDLVTDEVLVPEGLSVRTRDNKKVILERNKLDYKMKVLPGPYKVFANKTGYNEYYALITLEPYQLKYIVYLVKMEEDEEPDPVVDTNTNDSIEIITLIENMPPPVEEPPVDTLVVNKEPEPHYHPPVDSLPKPEVGGELSMREYTRNNVILIVDVSSSMNRGGKLDALKSSFNTLVDALRPEDRIAIVSMSSNAEIVQPPTGVYEKDSLKARLAAMKAIGGTNGGAAIQMAYSLARANFITDGNNQVIIATDGVFYGGTLSRRQIEELIAKGNTEGIHMSAVAFGSDPKAVMFLESLTQKGGGSFVQISGKEEEETRLLEMIKTQSKRK